MTLAQPAPNGVLSAAGARTGHYRFRVIVRYPDGHEHSERFANGDEFRQRLEAFEQNLVVQHWTGRSGPVILPYGWPNKRLT